MRNTSTQVIRPENIHQRPERLGNTPSYGHDSFKFQCKRLTIPTFRRRSLLVGCGYELQKYVHPSALAQRRAEEQGNNFVIAEIAWANS